MWAVSLLRGCKVLAEKLFPHFLLLIVRKSLPSTFTSAVLRRQREKASGLHRFSHAGFFLFCSRQLEMFLFCWNCIKCISIMGLHGIKLFFFYFIFCLCWSLWVVWSVCMGGISLRSTGYFIAYDTCYFRDTVLFKDILRYDSLSFTYTKFRIYSQIFKV